MASKVATFAQRLRQLLDVTGISQAELCRQTDISKSRMSHYMSGHWEAKQDGIYAICKATGVEYDWLMGYDAPMRRDAPPAISEQSSDPDVSLLEAFHRLDKDDQAFIRGEIRALLQNEKYAPKRASSAG